MREELIATVPGTVTELDTDIDATRYVLYHRVEQNLDFVTVSQQVIASYESSFSESTFITFPVEDMDAIAVAWLKWREMIEEI